LISLTGLERRALLILFKDFATLYNGSLLSARLGCSRMGALKLLRRLEAAGLVAAQSVGRTKVFRLTWRNDCCQTLLAFLLLDEAEGFRRWKEDFRELGRKAEILVFFGSAVSGEEKAHDVDLLVIAPAREKISSLVQRRQALMAKRLHVIRITREELVANLRDRNPAAIEILRTGIILFGQEKLIGVIQDVTGERPDAVVP